ncbi:MAG: DUF6366 family protein [Bacillaceae bacterium]|nr:DUF6366 family protein [Bacillaceae bacterium]
MEAFLQHPQRLADIVGRLGWKGTGIIIPVIIISFIIASFS